MQPHRQLSMGLIALGAGAALTALLGPFGTGTLHYRTSELALNQIRGGDAAALLVLAPLCAVVAVLALRRHPAAPVLALGPAVYAVYMYSQLILGNEYGQVPGNVERFFPLLLSLVLTGAWVGVSATRLLRTTRLPATTARFDRVTGGVLLVLAAYVVLGIHLGSYLDAVSASPSDPQYLGAPTAFWVVKLWDLGAVVPAAVVVGVGLLRGRAWAKAPMYAIIGGYLLLACSVAGMAWAMYAADDPGGSLAQALTVSAFVGALLAAALRLYRPLLRGPWVSVATRSSSDRSSDRSSDPPMDGHRAIISRASR